MSMINFGIDLGTTNSLIARFKGGQVEVFKNPVGFKETLPSVVGFRNDRIMVGDNARSYAQKDAKSVVSRFKRKMGTSETFKIKSLNASKSPTELSAFVLKELKNFVQTGEQLEAAVITIPASFDTLQSNATKDAGRLAGFKHVVLLQEPIAASLAYANRAGAQDLRNSQWIVYDFGGGTFDVALVRIVEGELTVIDHEGDNYLGGTDFDALIVEKLIVPALEQRGKFTDLLSQLRSESGRYATLYPVLLQLAEDAKVELSTKTSAEIDLGMHNLQDEAGNSVDALLPITRSEYEALIKEAVDASAAMLKKILTRNSLQPQDLKFVLMVGGTTYTPFVRKRIQELLGIPVNTDIDPTNAIAIGAGYFAATREVGAEAKGPAKPNARNLKLRVNYNRNTQEREETFSVKIEGDLAGLSYRIQRDDGAFDSGLKKLTTRISEDLPLREGAFNIFSFKILDAQGTSLPLDFDSIQIAQGRYSVAGQMLPEDLSLVTDDVSNKDTRLQCVFARNTVLPAKGKTTKEVGKTIVKGSSDEIRIIVVEGPADHHSSTNKPLGVLRISGTQISRDLLRGTEVDLTFAMSESRDLTVSAYLNGTGQEFSQVFDPKARTVPVDVLASDIMQLEERIEQEQEAAEQGNRKELAVSLDKLLTQAQDLISQAGKLNPDDVTDDKFKLEDRKRAVAQALFQLTSSRRLDTARSTYRTARTEAAEVIQKSGNDRERHQLAEILAREASFIESSNPERLETATAELERLKYQVLSRLPEFQMGMFQYLSEHQPSMNDQLQAKQLLEAGRQHVRLERWDELAKVNSRLFDLLPDGDAALEEFRMQTGIV